MLPSLSNTHRKFEFHGCFAAVLVTHVLRFNCSSLLSQGSLFFELIQKIRMILINTLVVKYDPLVAQFPVANGFDLLFYY